MEIIFYCRNLILIQNCSESLIVVVNKSLLANLKTYKFLNSEEIELLLMYTH